MLTAIFNKAQGRQPLYYRGNHIVKPVEQSSLTNEDWIAFLFDNIPEGAMPLGTSFVWHPECVEGDAKYKWKYRPLPVGMKLYNGGPFDPYSPRASNYISISSFYPDEAGEYKRRDTSFAALHAIMIDDIGTKVPIDNIIVMPSVLIETSKGNFQAWYKLDPPLRSLETANMLINAFVAKLKHDCNLVTRIGRLPVGSNTKYDPPTPHVVRTAPLTRHNPMDLVKAYGLILKKPEAKNVLPHPKADTIARWLHENGYVKRVNDKGWLVLHCPLGAHDDDDGTGYRPPTHNEPDGRFRCHHAKCKGKATNELLSFIEGRVLEKIAKWGAK